METLSAARFVPFPVNEIPPPVGRRNDEWGAKGLRAIDDLAADDRQKYVVLRV